MPLPPDLVEAAFQRVTLAVAQRTETGGQSLAAALLAFREDLASAVLDDERLDDRERIEKRAAYAHLKRWLEERETAFQQDLQICQDSGKLDSRQLPFLNSSPAAPTQEPNVESANPFNT